jgi:hypothetical protein
MGIREETFYFAVKMYFTSTFLVKVEMIKCDPYIKSCTCQHAAYSLTLDHKVVLSTWLREIFHSLYLT